MPVINYAQKASQFEDVLETLTSEKTYHYYNGESLSRVVDEQANAYLCLWVDQSDTDATYLYRPLSEDVFTDVEQLRISIRTALLDRTSSRLAYLVRYAGEDVSIEAVHVDDIEDFIPGHHFGINGEIVFVKDDNEQAA